jgi:2-iminobutanoate/2-iminopropanoate deaminase
VKKKIISTEHAPAAVGPYSQAVRVGKMLYTAGQIPMDPSTGQLVEGDIAAQTEQVVSNLRAVLEAAGTSLKNVVKTTVFLKDMADFGSMNTVYGHYFGKNSPARSTVEVAALPLGAQIEIEAIAIVKKRKS